MRQPNLWSLSLLCLAFTGCGMSPTTLTTGSSTGSGSGTTPAAAATGVVHGGQSPITGAAIYLYSFPQLDGFPQRSLLTNPVTTSDGSGQVNSNANAGNHFNQLPAGYFTITGDYTCPADNPQVLLLATGGNAGFSGTSSNGALEAFAPLGDCNTLLANAATTIVNLNEVTTVAATYALTQFIEEGGYVTYAPQGFVNAVATFNNLVDIRTGMARATTPNGNGIIPQAEINTLANIVASCVNSAPPSYAGCTSLANAASPGSGSNPDVSNAILHIAAFPGNNTNQPTRVNDIFSLAGGLGAPFQPSLTTAPNDWTLAVSYNTAGGNPASGALDSLGNLWITNFNGGGINSSVSMISFLGVPATNSPLQSHPLTDGVAALAIDTNNNVWVASQTNNTLGTLVAVPSGGHYSINTVLGPFTGSGLNTPAGLAIDAFNDVWAANPTNATLSEFQSNGSPLSGDNGYTSSGLINPSRIVFDNNDSLWVGNTTGNLAKFTGNGIPLVTVTQPTSGITRPFALATDSSSDLWVADASNAALVELGSAGNVKSPTPYTGGGITDSVAIAVDGSDITWIADRSGNSISEVIPGYVVTQSTGYQGGNLSTPNSLSIDASGNIWVTNGSPITVNSQKQTVTEFIGLAVPSMMPLARATANHQIGYAPGTGIPVVITSAGLPLYTTASPYNAKLYAAGGNSGNYTWSSSSAFPTGLSLSSSGLISGTPLASGSTTVSVKVCDSAVLTNCDTQNFTLASTSALAAGGSEAALNGSYAIRYVGYRNPVQVTGSINGADAIGSLVLDGAGHITGGTLDTLNPGGTLNTQTGVTGAYSVGSDHRGTLLIHRTGGSDLVFAISVGNFASTIAQTIHMIEFDDTLAVNGGQGGQIGAGIGKLQTNSAFAAATLNSAFVFGLAGETPCTNYNNTNPGCPQTVTPFGPISVAGRFVANGSGSITSGEEDAAGVATAWTAVPLTGSYANPDASTGRGTLTLTAGAATFPLPPTTMIYYIVNSGEMFLMSGSSHSTTTLLSGDALAQSGSFSNTTFTGSYVAWTTSATGGDGVSSFPYNGDVGIFLLAVDGANANVAITGDENKAGALKLNQSIGTAPYTVDSTGRATITGANVVFYLANSAQGFGMQQPSQSGDSNGLIVVQQQTGAGGFSNATVNGTYAFATLPPPTVASATSGVLVANGSSTSSATADSSQSSGQLAPNQTETFSYAIASNGRTSITNSNGGYDILYVIDANTAITFDTSVGDFNPTITWIQK